MQFMNIFKTKLLRLMFSENTELNVFVLFYVHEKACYEWIWLMQFTCVTINKFKLIIQHGSWLIRWIQDLTRLSADLENTLWSIHINRKIKSTIFLHLQVWCQALNSKLTNVCVTIKIKSLPLIYGPPQWIKQIVINHCSLEAVLSPVT